MDFHGIEFGSTDPDSVKWKTKLMILVVKTREQPGLMLCCIMQPWVEKIKHLGNFRNQYRNQLDTNTRTTRYINKHNSITQELYFNKPEIKVKINRIYNDHFTGSPISQD